jgi:hypothetical protein
MSVHRREASTRGGVLRRLMPLVATGVFAIAAAAPATAATPTWWKVDTHQHSAFSGDARADIGLDVANDKSLGYNAVFLTDHDRLNSFSIQGANGNYLDYHDALSGRWLPKTLGSTSSSTNAVVTSPVHSGSNSLHLAVTSGTTTNGRTFVYAKRGGNLLSGDVTIDFWVRPVRIDAGAGVDASVSLGGDVTSGVRVYGYSTADGVAHPGKSTVLVWQLGAARAASSSGTTHVITSQLPYTLGTWNHYVIDVTTGAASWTPSGGGTTSLSTTGVNSLSAADRPANYAVLGYPKMEVSATNSSADAYFDDYVQKVAAPQCPAAAFVYRNSLIDSGAFNGQNAAGQSFVLFPAREMGQNNHTQQSNFDITSAGQFYDVYSDSVSNDAQLCAATNTSSAPWSFAYYGSDNIPSVQASGYPTQTNHPGVTDTTTDVINTQAHGADAVEVRTGDDYSSTWDAILQQNHQVIGTYGSDAHEGVGSGAPADFIDAPSPTLTSLMHSLFEGRLYMAPNTFAGRIVFNPDPASPSPYPARYPIYVPAGQSSASVHLSISSGLTSGQTVRWVYNSGSGIHTITDTPSGAGYSTTKSIPLSGSFTYVRAEIRDSAGNLLANTEPIFFEDVSGLPAGTSYHVDSVTPASGCACTVAMTKGITASSWNATANTLSLTLTNPSNSAGQLRLTSATAPSALTIDGSAIAASSSLSAFQSASSDAWYYDASADLLYIQDVQGSGSSTVSVSFSGGGGGTDSPPSVPTGLTATAVSSNEIDLSWNASTDSDGTGVAGYHLFRGGTQIATVTSGTSYKDTGLTPSTQYSYTVSAFDTASNESVQSSAAVATTPSGGGGGGTALFSDDFEGANLSKWSGASGVVVQSSVVYSGTHAARATATGSPAYAYKTFATPNSALYYRLRFNIQSQGATSMYLLRLRSAPNSPIMGLYAGSTGTLCYRNEFALVNTCGGLSPSKSAWHTALVHVIVNGTGSTVEVWLDGTKLISKTDNLGTAGVSRIELGDSASGKTFDVALDDVVVDTSALSP